MNTNQSFTDNNFTCMLNQYNYNLHLGDIIAGTIFNIEEKGFLIDIGLNIAGYLPYEEVSLKTYTINKEINYKNNETREFFILAYNKNSQQIILSIKRLEYIRAWKRIKQIESEDIILNLKIKSINRGGIITIIEGLQGFIPNSHLSTIKHKISLQKNFIKCKLLLANEKVNKLILSHKKAVLCTYANKLKIGDIVNGKIIQIKTYGVFIEIHDILSLLHISEIGYKNIKNLNKIFHIGETIKVQILHIDTKQGRLSVSRRNIT